jgi:hypothetical protein
MMRSKRPFRAVAIVLLLVSAFGGLSVGIPLLFAMLTDPTLIRPGGASVIVPALFLAYGLLSLAGAIWLLSGWARAIPVVVVPQASVAIALLWVHVAIVADASLLIVAGIAGGATLCALADRAFGGAA